MLRFVVIAGIVVGAAVAAPRFAPQLLAGLIAGEPGEGAQGADAPGAPPALGAPETPAGPRVVAVRPAAAPEPAPSASAAKESRRVSIPANRDGHFVVTALLEGRPVDAMVDTGATSVAITEATARRLGIFPRRDQFTLQVATANGVVQAAPVTVREVRGGAVAVRNVKAIVVPGDALALDLLGMTFLNRLAKFESANGRLLLVE